MSFLVILVPPRARLGAAGGDVAPAAAGGDYAYITSADGVTPGATGRAAPALLPRAESVVALLAPSDVSWQRITLPKAPAGRLRAALTGVLEEALLDDADALHLALAPGAAAGESTWVAAVHRAWLQEHLTALEKSGVPVERVVPAAWPEDTPAGHFDEAAAAEGSVAPMVLTWSDAQGVVSIRLQGGMARALLPAWAAQPARWTATPSVAAPAERWLGAPVHVVSPEQRALQASRSLWNLRQFDLAPRHRGTLALRDAWRRVLSPGWRPVRAGLAALVLLQVAGLNLWAWHQRQEIAAKRQAMVEVLRAAHPQVRAVLDAPVQMQRETDALRAAAGRPGEDDLEALLHAAASAWPDDRPPVEGLRFEPGRLTLSAAGWAEPQVEAFRSRLRAGGWAVESADGRVTLSRAAAAGSPS
jgi:general secretion pathway protein L